MIVLAGIPSEPPLALVREKLEKAGDKFIIFNQRDFEQININLNIENGEIKGKLGIRNRIYDMMDIESVYVRLMDYSFIPEVENEPVQSVKRLKCRFVHLHSRFFAKLLL